MTSEGRSEQAASLLVDRQIWFRSRVCHCLRDPSMPANPEGAVILDKLLFGIMVVAVVLLLLPFLLVMAGVAAATLFWFAAFAALLGAWVFWLVFPGTYGVAVLLLSLLIGLLLIDRRSRHGAFW